MNGIDVLVIFLVLFWAIISGVHIYRRKKSGKCIGCMGCAKKCE